MPLNWTELASLPQISPGETFLVMPILLESYVFMYSVFIVH